MRATVAGIALALAGGCGDDRSRAEYDLREPARPEKGTVDGGAPGSGEWRKSQVVGCDRAPVLMVGDQYIGPVTREDVDALLERLRQEDSPTTIRLADEIVQCQLHKSEQG